MQLSELIDQEGLSNISVKTTISKDNVNHLIEENFQKLTRVKALGFLLILEREYKELDVSLLRESVKLYFENNKPDVDNVIVMSKEQTSSVRGGFSFFKWFVILGIFWGAWYLYSQGNLDNLLKNIESKEESYDDSKALESNVSLEDAERVSVVINVKKPSDMETPVAPKMEESIVLSSENTTKELNVTTQIESVLSTVSAEVSDENQSLILRAEESLSENNATVSAITTITINPTRGMLWFGFINIDTKQRKEFMKKVSTPFDIQDGKWLLVTGHGYVDIVSEEKTVEVADRKKHYFYIDSKEIRELTQREFRAMNGRRGW